MMQCNGPLLENPWHWLICAQTPCAWSCCTNFPYTLWGSVNLYFWVPFKTSQWILGTKMRFWRGISSSMKYIRIPNTKTIVSMFVIFPQVGIWNVIFCNVYSIPLNRNSRIGFTYPTCGWLSFQDQPLYCQLFKFSCVFMWDCQWIKFWVPSRANCVTLIEDM